MADTPSTPTPEEADAQRDTARRIVEAGIADETAGYDAAITPDGKTADEPEPDRE